MLNGKVAIVTGASRGIGRDVAVALAKAGARVVVSARTEQESGKLPGTIHSTVDAIQKAGGEAMPFRCNVAVEEDVQRMVDGTLSKWGQIDVLVNNAGIGSYLPFTEVTAKHWDLVVAVNLRGTFLSTKAVVPGMISRRCGSIINVSSTAADRLFSMTLPKEGQDLTLMGSVYGATKAAVERLTLSLAAELGKHNIAVNAVKPARPVMSEGLMAWRGAEADYSQWVSADRMVKAVLFLAAQTSKGCTGVVLTDEEYIVRHGL